MVVEINWNNFRAKFNNREQPAFERLCYLLFCKEFNKNIGIFRFKNHAGIETNPIEKDGQVIGWQAKFYGTRLSEHENDFTDSIDTTKTRHPTVNKIIFYTNQEFGQDSKKTDPKYKLNIESHAKSKNIDIEWRTASYFEAPFVYEQNFSIAQHFFSLQKGILDSITELSAYTESVLKSIRSEIVFSANKIKLDRSSVVTSLGQLVNSSPFIILSGGAGVGKTAVIKDFYETAKNTAPFFVFKATQFKNIPCINQLFNNYGEITSSEFINEHKDIKQKYVVIDSAERLSEIEDQDVFRGFLSDLLDNGWNVIFTVRYGYLDDLRYQLKEIYGANFTSLNIPDLTDAELENISKDYNFKLPQNERLYSLLKTPLYLNEYLKNYADTKGNISYADFRDIIWKKQIQDSSHQLHNLHRQREECFLKIAQKRANDGGFFVKASDCDQEALQKLEADEIIKYDINVGGYFITHDVYEEWALDKIIERSFRSVQDYQIFYQEIGGSLPIRRAFRSWLSDKLFANDEDAKKLIEFTVGDNQIDNYWKDEVLVSVLLSDYSSVFFEHFKEELLKEPKKTVSYDGSSKLVQTLTVSYKDEDSLLHKILFLLRIACKTIDEDFLRRLGLTKIKGIALKTVFTTPKGQGWNCTIDFVNKHREKLQFRYINAILPVLDDWNNKYKDGETTKNASQMALFYYDELTKQEGFYFSSRDDTKDKLIRTILNGSYEIKEELTHIVDEIITQKDTSHRGRYYELVEKVLSSVPDNFEIARNLPEQVIKLAELFWFQPQDEKDWKFNHKMGVEQYFCLPEDHLDYFPASAFQTPVYNLLRFAPQQTVNFILWLVNKAVECYANSELKNEVEEVEVFINEKETIKQYISHRLWNAYRGTQVSTHLLESIHMALERWMLEYAKNTPADILEQWCLYLIKKSKSASITAIVASVVLSQPSKLFNIAKIIFRTKDFFPYDTSRLILDQGAKGYFSIGYVISNHESNFYRDERISTCEDKHRQGSLENLALNYQIFRSGEIDQVEAKKRQEVLWEIFDEYYKRLPDKSMETEQDKTWRLYLARMDRRKMKLATEEKDGQVLISFNPEIDPELKKYSEESLARTSESMQYIPLQLWARNRFERNESGYKTYPQYENDYKLVILDTKKIIEKLRSSGEKTDKSFALFYHSVPPYACAVLVRDYLEKLDVEEKKFCKDIIIDYASMPLGKNYRYQMGDGVGIAINTITLLLKLFPEDRGKIKTILLFTLFDSYPVGMNQRFSDYPTEAILHNLWKESFVDANSIFLGFLLLKPKYDDLRESIRKKNYKRGIYNISNHELLKQFNQKNEVEIARVISNEITYNEASSLEDVDADTLATSFRLLPLETTSEDHKRFMEQIFPIFSEKLFKVGYKRDDEDKIDYGTKHRFLEKFAYVILTSKIEDIEAYLKPFLNDFKNSEDAAEFFSEFISTEDKLAQYEQFWTVWKLFYAKIMDLGKNKNSRIYSNKILHNYLLAWGYWKEDAKEWHTLKDRERSFFKKVSEDIGENPVVLYSLSKLLNEIGSSFKDDGIIWISDILRKNPELSNEELEVNTVYYLENIVRSYILKNRQKIKTTLQLKNQILVILDFLFRKGSVSGYLLREDVL